jgi:hypothetical protein
MPRPAVPEPDHELWPKMRGAMSPGQFQNWMSAFVVSDTDDGRVLLTAPTPFLRDFVRGNYAPVLEQAFGRPVRFAVRETHAA